MYIILTFYENAPCSKLPVKVWGFQPSAGISHNPFLQVTGVSASCVTKARGLQGSVVCSNSLRHRLSTQGRPRSGELRSIRAVMHQAERDAP